MGYLGLVGMTWGWFVGAVMGQVSLSVSSQVSLMTVDCLNAVFGLCLS